MVEWWNSLGPDVRSIIGAAIAGASGGLVRSLNEGTRWPQLLIDIVTGALLAVYLGPQVTAIIDGPMGLIEADDSAASLGGFLCGVLGMFLIELITLVARKRAKTLETDE